jgi:hypothetical protein
MYVLGWAGMGMEVEYVGIPVLYVMFWRFEVITNTSNVNWYFDICIFT